MQKPILVLFGAPGVGKTTFGNDIPNRLFIACERGARMVKGPRVPKDDYCRTWQDFMSCLKEVAKGGHKADWVVVDTVSATENMLADEICQREFNGIWNSEAGQSGFNAFARGAKRVSQEFRQILPLLEDINDAGAGIVLLSHAGMHRASNLLGSDYQRLAPRMERFSWNVLEEHCDLVGFAGPEVRATVRTGENKAKASMVGDSRWIWFGQHPARVSKVRAGFSMPDKMLLDWGAFSKELGADPVPDMAEEAFGLFKEASEPDQKIVAGRLEGDVNIETLKAIGKRRLEQLIGWLKSQQTQEND